MRRRLPILLPLAAVPVGTAVARAAVLPAGLPPSAEEPTLDRTRGALIARWADHWNTAPATVRVAVRPRAAASSTLRCMPDDEVRPVRVPLRR